MGDRLRIAAATVNVVPFNCIICFEEFNLKDRLPQVLPCGHTFVCEPCSKRLKRCMECREPLYYTKSTVSPNKHMYRSPVGGRYSPTPMTPPQNSNSPLPGTVQQVRYPIAKNVVLMSMMEAAARMEKERQEGARDDSLRTDEEEELDINNIICGVANLTGPSGTYAVRDPKGIEIVKEIASALPPSERELNIAASEDSVEIREPGNTIARGQTVQVVSFSNGVAKLARGQGFVQADSSQLVRVGEPKEKTCRLEGLLDTISRRGADLEKELEDNRKMEAKLRRQIDEEMAKEPDHPIISGPPKIDIEPDPKAKDVVGPSTPTDVRTLNEMSHSELHTPTTTPDSAVLQGPGATVRVTDHDDMALPLCAFPTEGASLGVHSLPMYRRTSSNDSLTELGYGCTAFLGTGVHMFSESERQLVVSQTRERAHSSEHDDHSLTAASFDTIDFRTGMSGHRGLNNSKKYNPTNSPIPRKSGRLMMSVHDGIAAFRGKKDRTSPS